MNKVLALAGLSMLIGLSNPANAEFEYDYLAVDYQYLETDALDVFLQPLPLTANGYGIHFSHDYDNNMIVVASLSRFDFDDVNGFSSTQDLFKFGAGYHHSFSEFYDVYGTLSYVGIETDVSGGSISDDGFEIVAGFRAWPSAVLELDGFIQYADYEDPLEQTLSEVSATGQARWHINDTFSIGLGASVGENTTSYFGNVRLSFESLPFGL